MGSTCLRSPIDTEGFIRETVRLTTIPPYVRPSREIPPPSPNLFSWQEIARKTANLPSYRSDKSVIPRLNYLLVYG
jgi:hypothetical protein